MLILALLFVLGSSGKYGRCPYHAQRPAESPQVNDALDDMNKILQQSYATNKQAMLDDLLARGIPVVESRGGLTLYVRNQTYKLPDLWGQEFEDMKLASHIALSAFVQMQPTLSNSQQDAGGGPVALHPSNAAQLADYLETFDNLTAAIRSRNYTEEQEERELQVAAAVKGLVAQAVTTGQLSATAVYPVFRSLRDGPIHTNIAHAAQVSLDRVHQQMLEWKSQVLTQAEWDSMWVVVGVSHMARHSAEMLQYFSTLLNTKIGTGYRLVAAENEQTWDILSTHLIDFTIGSAFFANFEHMHADILADAARAYIPKLLPGYPNPNILPTPPAVSDGKISLSSTQLAFVAVGLVLMGVGIGYFISSYVRSNKRQTEQFRSLQASLPLED